MSEHNIDKINDAVEKVLQHLLSTEADLMAVMIRGSHVTGLTTPTSDVDMYIVTNVTGPETFHYFQDGLDFHIRRYPEKYLSYEIAEHNLRYIGFFRHARALYDPQGIFLKLKDVVENIPATDLASTWLREAKHQARDAKGQIEKRDFETALYIMRFGSHILAWAALLPTPQATYKGKDVITRLRESQDLEDFRDNLFQLMDLKEFNSEDVKAKYALFATTIDLIEEHLLANKQIPKRERH